MNGRAIIASPTPTSYDQLLKAWPYYDLSLTCQIEWSIAFVKSVRDKIQLFIEFRQQYDNALLVGDIETCIRSLDMVERCTGRSFWLFEQRISTLQASRGLKAQKDFAHESRLNSAAGAWFNATSHLISELHEENTSAHAFADRLRGSVSRQHFPEELGLFLRFYLLDDSFGADATASILAVAASASAVDLYETLVKIARFAVATNQNDVFVGGKSFEGLARSLEDPRLLRIESLLKADPALAPPGMLRDLSIDNALILKEQSATIVDLDINDADASRAFALAALRARLCVKAPTGDSALQAFSRLAQHVIEKSNDTRNSIQALYKLRLTLRHSSLGPFIDLCAAQENDDYAIAPNEKLRDLYCASPYLELINSTALFPEYDRILSEAYGLQTPALALMLSRTEQGQSEIRTEFTALANAASLFQSKSYKEAATCLLGIFDLESADLRALRHARRMYASCLLESDDLGAAIHFIVSIALLDENAASMLPIRKAASRLFDHTLRKKLNGSIDVPILLELAVHFGASDLKHIRDYACEDFLGLSNVELPSQLIIDEDDHSHRAMVFFLRYICRPDILEMLPSFETGAEAFSERIAVLRRLKQIDPSAEVAYEAEITNLSRDEAIRNALHFTEQSKISIDEEALIQWASSTLRESFERFVALKDACLVDTSVIRISTSDEAERDEAAVLSRRMMSEFVAQAMLNPTFGLDCFLSMRIRHGTLYGQLRVYLEEFHLITPLAADGRRQVNQFWQDAINITDGKTLKSLDEALSEFSNRYDAAINTFIKNIIQVRSDLHPDAAFVSELSPLAQDIVTQEMADIASFDTFLSAALQLTWALISEGLGKVHNYIDSRLKPTINSAFSELERRIDRLRIEESAEDLMQSITMAKTEAIANLNRVKNWFEMPRPLLSSPRLPMDQIIDIGLQSVRELHADFNPSVTKDVETGNVVFPIQLLADILQLLFDNIHRHSGLSDPHVLVIVRSGDKSVDFTVISDIGPDALKGEALIRFEAAREALERGRAASRVSKEGGSGFAKLQRSLGEAASTLKVCYLGEDEFSVTFSMYLQELSI